MAGSSKIKRRLVVACLALGLSAIPVLVMVTASALSRQGQAYTVPQVREGLLREPAAWRGRTVWVRGTVLVTHCEAHGCGGFPLGADPIDGSPPLWVHPQPSQPLIVALRHAPLLGRFLPRAQMVRYGSGTYRLTFIGVPSCTVLAAAPCAIRRVDAVLPDADL